VYWYINLISPDYGHRCNNNDQFNAEDESVENIDGVQIDSQIVNINCGTFLSHFEYGALQNHNNSYSNNITVSASDTLYE